MEKIKYLIWEKDHSDCSEVQVYKSLDRKIFFFFSRNIELIEVGGGGTGWQVKAVKVNKVFI